MVYHVILFGQQLLWRFKYRFNKIAHASIRVCWWLFVCVYVSRLCVYMCVEDMSKNKNVLIYNSMKIATEFTNWTYFFPYYLIIVHAILFLPFTKVSYTYLKIGTSRVFSNFDYLIRLLVSINRNLGNRFSQLLTVTIYLFKFIGLHHAGAPPWNIYSKKFDSKLTF